MSNRKKLDMDENLQQTGAVKSKKKVSQKKKKKKGSGWFIFGMVLYAVLFLGGVYYGLKFLWGYMEAYEASRPNNTVNAYMEQLTSEHIVDASQNVIDQIDHNLMSEEQCRQIMLGELSGGIRHARKSKECTDTRLVYVLRAGSRVVGEFSIEANEPDEFGFTTWSLAEESFDMSYLIGQSQSVTVPDVCTVTVNGVALDERYITVDNIPYEDIKAYYKDYDLPSQVTYEAGPLLGEFRMIVTDDAGNELTFDENTDWSVYYYNCTEEQTEELDEFVAMFLERYVDFAGSNKNTRHTNYNALIKHVVADSDLAKRLKDAVSGLQFGQSKGDVIVGTDTHLRIRLDDKFLVDMTYEVDTTGKEGVVRTTTNARLLIVDTDKGMKVESIIIY